MEKCSTNLPVSSLAGEQHGVFCVINVIVPILLGLLGSVLSLNALILGEGTVVTALVVC